jgi:hypothetical protein
LNVLVLGLGESGLAMVRWCVRHGAAVRVWDSRDQPPHAARCAPTCRRSRCSAGLATRCPRACWCSRAPAWHRTTAASRRCWPARVPPAWRCWPSWTCSAALADLKAQTRSDAEARLADQARLAEQAAAAAAAGSGGAGGERALPIHGRALADGLPAPVIARRHRPTPAMRRSSRHHRHQRQDHHHRDDRLLVERAGRRVAVAGNIMPTMLDRLMVMLDGPRDAWVQVWVLELSSFQLDGVAASSPAPPRCSTSRRTTWTGTARWPPMPRPRRASSAVQAVMVVNRDDPRSRRWCRRRWSPRSAAASP